jgi:hypothetical protein
MIPFRLPMDNRKMRSLIRGQHDAAIAPAVRSEHSLRDIALTIHGDPSLIVVSV